MPNNHNSNAKYSPTPNGDIEMNKMVLDHNSYNTPDGVPQGKGKNASPTSGQGGGGGKNQRELRIYYTGESHFKRRTKLEKYLMVSCLILFVALVAFLIIALTRDSKGKSLSPLSPFELNSLLSSKWPSHNLVNLMNHDKNPKLVKLPNVVPIWQKRHYQW